MKIMVFSGTKQECTKNAKALVKKGELVQVVYNDYFGVWQVDIFEKDENGFLI